jgi:hypothetical protein
LYKLGIPSDALLRVVVAFTISSFGLIYLIWRTETNRREEFLRLAARPSSQRFLNFRRKERRCLIKIYIVDYILVGTLTASLLVATR